MRGCRCSQRRNYRGKLYRVPDQFKDGQGKRTAADDRVLHERNLCQNRIFGSELF